MPPVKQETIDSLFVATAALVKSVPIGIGASLFLGLDLNDWAKVVGIVWGLLCIAGWIYDRAARLRQRHE